MDQCLWGLWAQLGKAWVLLLGTGGLGGPLSIDHLSGLVKATLPRVLSLGWEDPQEEVMAIRSSILASRMPCVEEPGGRQSIASQRVGHY